MPIDFHGDMDKYLIGKRRKKLFSNLKSKLMNKRAILSYKTTSKFGKLKGKFISKVSDIKKKRQEPKKEITRDQIDSLVDNKGIKRDVKNEPKGKIVPLKEENESGWQEVKLEELQGIKEANNLEEEKEKLQEDIIKLQGKEDLEKEKIAKLNDENLQRERAESEDDRLKRLELEDEVKVLKEKQRIEEERLAELKGARRKEQMDALRGRVTDILFKKKQKIKHKEIVESIKKEVNQEGLGETETPSEADDAGKPKEDVTQVEEKNEHKALEKSEVRNESVVDKISESLYKKFDKKVEKIVEEKVKEKLREKKAKEVLEKKKEAKKEKEMEISKKKNKPKKSFISNFIQIKTAAEIAKEEKEMLKREEKESLKAQSEINTIFSQDGVEVKSNVPAEQQDINMSTLFSGEDVPSNQSQEEDLFPEKATQKEKQENADTIELDQGYKIKVVKNR